MYCKYLMFLSIKRLVVLNKQPRKDYLVNCYRSVVSTSLISRSLNLTREYSSTPLFLHTKKKQNIWECSIHFKNMGKLEGELMNAQCSCALCHCDKVQHGFSAFDENGMNGNASIVLMHWQTELCFEVSSPSVHFDLGFVL